MIIESIFKIIRPLIFTNRRFFLTILGFTQSYSYPTNDIDGLFQLIAGSYKSKRPIIIIGIDKIYLKADCKNGSIVNGFRESILSSFATNQQPSYKIFKEPTVKLFSKVNKSVLSHITFHLEDDDHKGVNLTVKR